ncbi:hypothetical protein BH20BAC1_BH20BAC1_12830 [soil metagenome]
MEALLNIVSRIQQNQGSRIDPTSIPSGFPNFNDVMRGGFQRARLYIICQKDSAAESSLLVSLAADVLHFSEDEERVGMIALNISEEQWMSRLLSNISEVPLEQILRGRLEHRYLKKLEATINSPEFDQLELAAGGYMTLDKVVDTCSDWVKNKNVEIIFMDYPQLISVPGVSDDQLKIQTVCQALSTLAQDLEVPVIVSIPLSNYQNKIGLHQLRQLGPVEPFADVILFLNDCEEETHDSNYKKVLLSIAKNNNGQLDNLLIRSIPHLVKFVELEHFDVF